MKYINGAVVFLIATFSQQYFCTNVLILDSALQNACSDLTFEPIRYSMKVSEIT